MWAATSTAGSEPLVAPAGAPSANTGAAVFAATTVTVDGVRGTIATGP